MDTSKLGISSYALFFADLLSMWKNWLMPFMKVVEIGWWPSGSISSFISYLLATENMPMRVSISLAKPLYHLVSGALTISSGGVLWTQLENQVKTTHDLEMEHWNAAFKVHVATAGGNVNAPTITRTGMALSTLWQVFFLWFCYWHPDTTKRKMKTRWLMLYIENTMYLKQKAHMWSSNSMKSRQQNWQKVY